MGVIELDPREVVKAVDGSGSYYIEPEQGKVQAHSNPTKLKTSGRTIVEDQPADVDLKSDQDLHLLNPSETVTARVRVDPQNFELNLFPRRVVERPADSGARQQDDGVDTALINVAASSSDFANFNPSEERRYHQLSLGLQSRNGVDLYDITVTVEFGRASGPEAREYVINPSQQLITFTPPILNPGGDPINVNVLNQGSSSIFVNVRLNYVVIE